MNLKWKIGFLLLIGIISGCSKEPSVTTSTKQEDVPIELMETVSNDYPIILKFNEINTTLEHEHQNFMELISGEGYSPFYPEYKFLEKLDADIFPEPQLQKCYGCFRKIDTVNAFKRKIDLADNEILVIGMNNELGEYQHHISLSDNYQLRAANDLAINYLRYKKAEENTEQEFDFDLNFLEHVFNIVTTKLTFNIAYQAVYGVPIELDNLPKNYVTYDDSKKIISFQNIDSAHAYQKIRLDFKAKVDKDIAMNIIHAEKTLHLGYVFSFADEKLALKNIIIFKDVIDQNLKVPYQDFDLLAVFEPIDLTFQRYKYDVGHYVPLEKVSVKVGMPMDFKFGLQSYTPIEKIYKPFD